MPTVTPFITLTANLQSIIGDAELGGAALMITLCGYGQTIPVVPGQGVLADAGVPQIIAQSGSTPISVQLFSNAQITPTSTFYEIAVIDENQNVIQSGVYQFNNQSSATYDLSQLVQIVNGLPSIHQESQAVVTPTYQVALLRIPSAIILLTVNGAYQDSSKYAQSGNILTMNFELRTGAKVGIAYVSPGTVPSLYTPGVVHVDNLTSQIPATVFTLSRAPLNGIPIAVCDGALFMTPGVDYVIPISGTSLTLTQPLLRGTLYAIYFG